MRAQMPRASKFIFIYVTCPNKVLARVIAKQLLKQKLVACANIVPGMESHYKWKGKMCQDKEIVLLLKTTKSKFKSVEREVSLLHSYDTPCILAFPVVAGASKYLSWLKSGLSS